MENIYIQFADKPEYKFWLIEKWDIYNQALLDLTGNFKIELDPYDYRLSMGGLSFSILAKKYGNIYRIIDILINSIMPDDQYLKYNEKRRFSIFREDGGLIYSGYINSAKENNGKLDFQGIHLIAYYDQDSYLIGHRKKTTDPKLNMHTVYTAREFFQNAISFGMPPFLDMIDSEAWQIAKDDFNNRFMFSDQPRTFDIYDACFANWHLLTNSWNKIPLKSLEFIKSYIIPITLCHVAPGMDQRWYAFFMQDRWYNSSSAITINDTNILLLDNDQLQIPGQKWDADKKKNGVKVLWGLTQKDKGNSRSYQFSREFYQLVEYPLENMYPPMERKPLDLSLWHLRPLERNSGDASEEYHSPPLAWGVPHNLVDDYSYQNNLMSQHNALLDVFRYGFLKLLFLRNGATEINGIKTNKVLNIGQIIKLNSKKLKYLNILDSLNDSLFNDSQSRILITTMNYDMKTGMYEYDGLIDTKNNLYHIQTTQTLHTTDIGICFYNANNRLKNTGKALEVPDTKIYFPGFPLPPAKSFGGYNKIYRIRKKLIIGTQEYLNPNTKYRIALSTHTRGYHYLPEHFKTDYASSCRIDEDLWLPGAGNQSIEYEWDHWVCAYDTPVMGSDYYYPASTYNYFFQWLMFVFWYIDSRISISTAMLEVKEVEEVTFELIRS